MASDTDIAWAAGLFAQRIAAADAITALLAQPEPQTLEGRMAYVVDLMWATVRLQLLMQGIAEGA